MRKLTTVLILSVLACGGPPHGGREAPAAARIPSALVIDKVVEGSIRGQTLANPYGLASAPDGGFYLADNSHHRVIRFDSTFKATHEIGGYGFDGGLLNRPTFLVLDNSLNLWVTDEGNRRIVRYDARLNFVDDIELRDEDDPFKFGRPAGVGVTDYGEVWVADADRDRIAIFDNTLKFDRFIGEFGSSGGQLRAPEKIAALPGGGFVVADAGNSRLVCYDSYGNFDRDLGESQLVEPIAVTGDKGLLWILEKSGDQVLCIDVRGRQPLTAVPVVLGSHKRLNHPRDIAVLADGRLIIADSGNNRVVVCRPMYDEVR